MAITNFGPGTFVWTDGAPTHNPDDGAKFAIDINTYVQYEWVSGTTWVVSPISVKKISGTSAPSGAPGLHDSQLAINEVPELYYYFSGSWHLVSGGGGGSYTDEMAQDAVGGILTDTAEIDFTYNDATPSITADLKTTTVTPGTYNNITVDSKGRATGGSNAAYITGNQTITLTGDVTGSGTTGIVTSISADAVGTTEIADDAVTQAKIAAGAVGSSELQSTAVTAGSYGSATQVATFTVDADGRLTAAANTAIAGDNWGTQVVEHGSTLSGNGTTGSPLNVATDGITANEIAPGAVGSSELASTSVTPGSYTYASFTVDADGRLTAASDGATPLTAVTTDTTLTGDGTVGSPVGISFPILAPDGSSGAPSYSFSNAASTGVFYDGTDVYLRSEADKGVRIQTADSGEPFDVVVTAGSGNVGADISLITGTGSTNRGGNITATLGSSTDDTGGSMTVNAGNSTNSAGGSITMNSGDGNSAGGVFTLAGGDGVEGSGGGFSATAGNSTNGDGGGFAMSAGSSTNAVGGNFLMTAGNSSGTNTNAGVFTITSGSNPTGVGGDFNMNAGNGLFGGSFSMQAGNSTAEEEAAGSFFILGGESTGDNGSGGVLNMRGGFGNSVTTTGGAANLLGGQSFYRGGAATVYGGQTTAGSLKGGDVGIGGGSGPGGAGLVYIDASMFRLAQFTTTQRDALTGVPAGAMIFNTTTSKFQGYTGSAWVDFH